MGLDDGLNQLLPVPSPRDLPITWISAAVNEPFQTNSESYVEWVDIFHRLIELGREPSWIRTQRRVTVNQLRRVKPQVIPKPAHQVGR